MPMLSRFFRSDDGATAVEYSVMLALIIVVCIGAVSNLGSSNGGLWGGNSDTLVQEMGSGGTGS